MNVGDWVVIEDYGFETAVVDSTTEKQFWAKVGHGRRLRRFRKQDALACGPDKEAMVALVEKLKSAKAECQNREKQARAWYAKRRAELLSKDPTQ